MARDHVQPAQSVSAADVLAIYRGDPVAHLVHALFARRPWLLFAAAAVGGAVCLYVIPATNGTLALRPHFDSALSDVNSAIIWLALVPVAALAYLEQFRAVPALFDKLQANGVTGLSPDEYEKFLAQCSRRYTRRTWPIVSALILAPVWAAFMISVARSPYTWYFPPNVWPWILYNAIQYLENFAAVCYAIRYIITCAQLRALLPDTRLRPQFLHPDGLGGLAPVITFVQHSLVIAGGVLLVVTLESINTSRTVAHFSEGSGLFGFIAVAVLYVTIVPYLLLYPLRLALRNARRAKHRLMEVISRRQSELIWEGSSHAPAGAGVQAEYELALLAHLRPLGEAQAALQTVPESVFELGLRSSQSLFLPTVIPPIVAIGYRVLADLTGFNWDNVIRALWSAVH